MNSRLAMVLLASMGVVASLFPIAVSAQPYPNKPVRLIVPFSPGGIVDIVARLTVEQLDRTLGQRVIVENKPGAGGNIGADALAKAAPDGYTLGLLSQGIVTTNRWLFKDMPFDPLIDLVAIAPIADSPQVVAVHSGVPAADIGAFIALAKRAPGTINYASAGNGTGPHFAAVHFARLAGVEMVHVPYRGAASAMADLATGQVQTILIGLAAFQEQMKAGTVRALAVMAQARLKALPDVPTMAEAGFSGYELTSWLWSLRAQEHAARCRRSAQSPRAGHVGRRRGSAPPLGYRHGAAARKPRAICLAGAGGSGVER